MNHKVLKVRKGDARRDVITMGVEFMDNQHDDETECLARSVIGAAIEVHSILGPGYLESIYEEALGKELMQRNINFDRQKIIAVRYKGFQVGESRLDFLIKDKLIVELKAVESLAAIHTAQVLSYLKLTGLNLGLIINFNVVSLRNGIKRIIYNPNHIKPVP